MKYSLFLDFDGTLATVDVGNRFFTHFSDGKNIPVVEKWIKREITSVECLTKEAELITASEQDIIRFASQFELDPGFESLCRLCESERIPVCIVSDGLDTYINSIMENHGYPDVPVYANRGVFNDGRLSIEFPYRDDSCDHCANCKGAAIRRLLPEGDKSIFVGDGYSDVCAVDAADYLFAKADLAKYLQKLDKHFLPYETLQDVTDRVSQIIRNG